MKKQKRFIGFTLIEMLVVIAIILLLAAILTPVLGRARESGRATRCISNLKNLHLAALNYASEGRLPLAASYVGQDQYGKYYEEKGWVAWWNYTSGSSSPGAYAQVAPNGIRCITNGTLHVYARSADIYMCPTLKITYPTYTRGYAMNSNMSWAVMTRVAATTSVLFGDDAGATSATADSAFGTNEVNKLHGGKKGHVVYVDGHVEKW